MAETQTCPRRMQEAGPWEQSEGLDEWRLRESRGTTRRCCSHCGSLHPDEFIALAESGAEVSPTDKTYQAYIDFGGHHWKFYYQHMSAKHVEQFVRRVEGNQLNLAFPGRFYVRPFVLARFANATFSFGAILRIEAVVPDGDIVSLVDPMYAYLVDQIRRDPTIIHRIDPRKWEEIVAAAYDRAGFDEVILTPRSGDHGRDVIAIKKGFGSVKFIDQVKAYKPGHVVTAAEVRELLGTLATEPSASKAILTTTSAFAPRIEDDQWIKPFLPTRLELVDKDKLIARLVGLEQSPTSAAPE